MADKKISQLNAAATPLAGTEVLPVVQGGSTVKVSVDNLTKGKTVLATSFDTDVAAAGVTLSGTTLSADGTDANINITITPKGTGEVAMAKVNIDGGAIDGTAIGANSASTGAFTTVSATTTGVAAGGFTGASTAAPGTTGFWDDSVAGINLVDSAGGAGYGVGVRFRPKNSVNTVAGIAAVAPSSTTSALAFHTQDANSSVPERVRITEGGQFAFNADGTAAAPVLSRVGDLNTGAFFAGTDIFAFSTSGTERARFTAGGYFKASNAGTYTGPTDAFHEFRQTADNATFQIIATSATLNNSVVIIRPNQNSTNNSFYAIDYYNDAAAAYKFRVADSGTVTNTTGTYGTISDAKMKTDIVDAGSQWNDIKAIRFRKFKMKDDPSGLMQLGVVAQEIEQTSPGLVEEHKDKDADGNDLGTTTKSVKTSVLLMKAAVALQEAMARIEKLEAEVVALKGAS